MAHKMGFEPLDVITEVDGQGTRKTGTYIVYLFLNPSLRLKASVWERRAIDLIGHPCMIDKSHHLIYDEILNEHFSWKYLIDVEIDLEMLIDH